MSPFSQANQHRVTGNGAWLLAEGPGHAEIPPAPRDTKQGEGLRLKMELTVKKSLVNQPTR